jgi:GNAT superfamily N-acetyltransferase
MAVRYFPLAEVNNRLVLAGLTYPTYRPHLLPNGSEHTVGVLAVSAEGPCGLSLAERSRGNEPARILSLFVAPSLRHRGLGGELLARLTDLLRDLREPRALAIFPAGKESTPAVERLLARQNWSPPRPRLYLFHASKSSVAALLQAS